MKVKLCKRILVREGPDDFLGNFTGYLQADAFGGYDGIYLSKPIIEVLCNAHALKSRIDPDNFWAKLEKLIEPES